jgi:hypothetical protein
MFRALCAHLQQRQNRVNTASLIVNPYWCPWLSLFDHPIIWRADPGGHAAWGVGLKQPDCLDRGLEIRRLYLLCVVYALSLTQENAVDLHSVDRVAQHPRQRPGGGGHTEPIRRRDLSGVSFKTSKPNPSTPPTSQNTTLSHTRNTRLYFSPLYL